MIGVQTSTAQANFLEKYFKDVIDIRQYKTTEQHDLDLAAGRVDGVFASISYLKGVVEEPQNKDMMLAGPRYGGGPLGFGVAVGLRKGDPELQAKFDAAVGARGGRRHRQDDVDEVVRLRHHAGTLTARTRPARVSQPGRSAHDRLRRADGLRPHGLGPAHGAGDADDGRRFLRARSRSAASLGALVAWARIEGNRAAAHRSRRLHDGAARNSGPAGDLPPLLRRQRGADRARACCWAPRASSASMHSPRGAIAVGIISGAYQGEIFRGAFHAIAARRARGRALGRHAAPAAASAGSSCPQALRFAIPGLGNVWQLALKESALISVVGLTEILRQAQVGAGSTRQPFAFFITAAALYLDALHASRAGASSAPRPSACAACGGA